MEAILYTRPGARSAPWIAAVLAALALAGALAAAASAPQVCDLALRHTAAAPRPAAI